MPTFPLPFIPSLSYQTGGRKFGANRDGGKRKHAACDLIAPKGTEIFAVDSGVVLRGPYYFYHGTYALEVQHTFFIVRYGEILQQLPADIHIGAHVTQGQVIAYVGKMRHDSMLHFEMYSGQASGPLTQRDDPKNKFQRRSDLIDPTSYLKEWEGYLLTCHV